MARSKLYNFFLVLIGIVLGTFVGYICKGVNALSWLAFGVDFGLEAPIVLDLGVLSLTFGFSINLTLSVVIFVILSLVIGRALAK
ncbi:MAG: DUF4321 domain-containing protein [Ruminococcaceae bacterium]|nr:DUF4321 domain-containing protein [Oscillospiraceae bacterium]